MLFNFFPFFSDGEFYWKGETKLKRSITCLFTQKSVSRHNFFHGINLQKGFGISIVKNLTEQQEMSDK